MTSQNVIAIFGLILAVAVIILILRLILLYKRLDNSFSKIGYVIREDAKKFFTDAEEKHLELQKNYLSSNKETVKAAVEEILEEQKKQTSQAYLEAQKLTEKMLGEAREKADRIVSLAETESQNISQRTMEKSAYVIESVLAEFVKESFTAKDHDKVIKRILADITKDER
ncbi:MAG TPA: hypothetical protein VMQ44_03275 [Candidatus Saccharimonadales bacterium]|nr:hypothetical protein [Candidatus Saccharimonadales bacterium]